MPLDDFILWPHALANLRAVEQLSAPLLDRV
jgi:hypothetical protein